MKDLLKEFSELKIEGLEPRIESYGKTLFVSSNDDNIGYVIDTYSSDIHNADCIQFIKEFLIEKKGYGISIYSEHEAVTVQIYSIQFDTFIVRVGRIDNSLNPETECFLRAVIGAWKKENE